MQIKKNLQKQLISNMRKQAVNVHTVPSTHVLQPILQYCLKWEYKNTMTWYQHTAGKLV